MTHPHPDSQPAGEPLDRHGMRHLWDHLGRVEERIRATVVTRRATDPAPDDPYRGLYINAETVHRILADRPDHDVDDGIGTAPPEAEPRLVRLAAAFDLSAVDVDLLLVALAPDVDVRFERLYGYLNDDVTRRRPTIGVALELCGLPAAGAGRFRLSATAPLVAGGLIEVQDPDRPALSRMLRVPDRVVAHLLGDDEPDPQLVGALSAFGVIGAPAADIKGHPALVERIGWALRGGVALWHLLETWAGAAELATAALADAGRGALVVDPAALAEEVRSAQSDAVLSALVREARLRGAGIVLGPLETSDRPDSVRMIRHLSARCAGVPLLTWGTRAWDPAWSAHPPLSVRVPAADADWQAARWRHALSEAAGAPVTTLPDGAFDGYRLGSTALRGAASIAVRLAQLDGRAVSDADLRAGALAQNSAGLERLARRIIPAVGWDDLVLPAATRRSLDDLVVRARYRDRVLGQWRLRPGGGRGRGVVALFAGESGTGKTMSAEVVAGALGMDLYVIDLSSVVDKYVGETEKNLERIFTEAAGVNGVLLFDEADAIFGKRSQVKDAHDRYANVESAYLLQRMESFDGIAVLTTNLRANLDAAFTRRLDVVADFPMPDATARRALWDRCLGTELPRGADLDLEFCAERFELAGGSIRACAVTTGYLAAASGRPAGMAEVIAAIQQEYRKLGRLLLDSEFGPWLPPVTTTSRGA